jgi:hypothetical protein
MKQNCIYRGNRSTKRKALIISNPGERGDENYCKGVYVDVENYKSHLISPLGGSWHNHEILSLDRPTKKQVNDYIKQLSYYDYTIIIFTGHGDHLKEKDRIIIELRKGEEYNSRDFKKSAKKRLIILDYCRKIYSKVIFEDVLTKAAVKAAKTLDLGRCRNAFDKEISKCTDGIIVGYSCLANERSGESESKGGYYSLGLLIEAKKWLENNTKYYDSLSIVSAHNGAKEFVVRETGDNQHPDIEKPNSDPYFPFAVIA